MYIPENQHFELHGGIAIADLSNTLQEIGLSLGSHVIEHGLIGFGDPNPTKIHSELIYHPNLLPYFMLGGVKAADDGGHNRIYNAVQAAAIIRAEQPELLDVTMVFHAEHYDSTKAVVPLVRNKQGEDFLAFRQRKGILNEVQNLPTTWNEEEFYQYIDEVLKRCLEFEHVLAPGEFLVVNNYKTLHVRTAYSGLRKVIRVRVDDPDAHKDYLIDREPIRNYEEI